MNKFWLIFRYEYLRHVLRKRFIFALLSFPLMALLTVGVGMLAALSEYDSSPVGYVDGSRLFNNPRQLPPNKDALFPELEMRPFANEEQARSALVAKQIQTYFLVDPDYLKTGKVKMVSLNTQKSSPQDDFIKFIRYNLLQAVPDQVSERILLGPDLTVQSIGDRRMNQGNIVNIFLPMIVGLLFIVVINTSGSYLVQALVEEKENRTMEIVVTSVSPGELMAGKVVGNLSVGLTELIVWLLFGVIGFLLAKRYIPAAGDFSISLDYIGLMAAALLPAFVMISSLMALAGATTADSREAQQWAGMFTLPVIIPFWLILPLMESPNSPLSIGLSLFPLTSPVSLAVRAAFTEIPAWQIVTSVGLLVLSAVGALWLAARVFRIGMLAYGKRLAWRQIFGRGKLA